MVIKLRLGENCMQVMKGLAYSAPHQHRNSHNSMIKTQTTGYWDALIACLLDPRSCHCSYPDNVVNAFVLEARKAGVDIFR